MLSKLKQGIIQVLVFSFIPFVYYIIVSKKISGFLYFIGFRSIYISNQFTLQSVIVMFVMGVLAILPLIYLFKKGVFSDEKLEVNRFENKKFGFPLLIEILIYSILVTSLSEEIFFRGFLAKVLMSSVGLVLGNIIHAILFGLIHGLPLKKYGKSTVIVMITLPAISAYLLAWNNELNNLGSIFPSIIIHSIINIISTIILLNLIKRSKKALTLE